MLKQIIDTHIHTWDLNHAKYDWLENDTTILNRTYPINLLENDRVEAGITQGVLVQAANNFEDTDWMFRTAANTSWIIGIVGWVPLMNPEITHDALEQFSKNPYFKGVRHLIHNEADDEWLLQEKVIESLQLIANYQLTFDVVGINNNHLKTALKVAEKIPTLKMVFDHLNQPPIKTKEQFGGWGELMKEAALHPNFFAKISGLGTASGNFTGWTAADVKPYIEFILQHYGAGRCFCGGDWPVSLLAGSYTETWKKYSTILHELLNENERQQVFFDSAKDFYRL